MKKLKRIAAWIAIIILLGMYVVTAIMAFFATPNSIQMFKASLIATIMLPVMMYIVAFIYRLIHPEEMEEEEEVLRDVEEK